MSIEEFSNEFDTLLNAAIIPSEGFGFESPLVFNEYEKSVFLTDALEEIVNSLYTGYNSTLESFEKTELVRRQLSELVKTIKPTKLTTTTDTISLDSILYLIPDDVMYITLETLKVQNISDECKDKSLFIEVVPIKLDDFLRASRNPFKTYNKRRAFRLDNNSSRIELITKYSDPSKYNLEYTIRYLKHPEPIILVNLEGTGLTIRNKTNVQTSLLNPSLHLNILLRAVLLAIMSRQLKQD